VFSVVCICNSLFISKFFGIFTWNLTNIFKHSRISNLVRRDLGFAVEISTCFETYSINGIAEFCFRPRSSNGTALQVSVSFITKQNFKCFFSNYICEECMAHALFQTLHSITTRSRAKNKVIFALVSHFCVYSTL
jgi:hypothetical protein